MMRGVRLVLGLSLLFAAGCSSSLPEASVASSEQAWTAGSEAAKAGDFTTALPLLEQAIDSPGLNIDQYVEAVLLRAQCYISTGNLEGAKADIAEAEQGAYDPGLFHYTKSMLYFKEGDTAQGNKEFSAARKADPSLKKPTI